MIQKIYKVKSPAKINIGLRVLNKRSDGYHNIETIFYPIPLFDELIIKISKRSSKTNKISVNTLPELGITKKKNICYKAADLFLSEFKIKNKYRIEILIRKKIPVGAGLGGGSSNAAEILKILAKHLKTKLDDTRLKEISLKLGSDVPFFILGKPALARSRGEKLRLLPQFKINCDILIVYPNIHVSTKWAYTRLNYKLKITNYKLPRKRGLENVQKFNLKELDIFQNDFEEVVFKKYPEIKAIKDEMYNQGAIFSLMSGSGSAVYGFFEKDVRKKSHHFMKHGNSVFVINKTSP